VPELPDLTVYLEALQQRIVGSRLDSITLNNPFLLRTAVPPLASAFGREVQELRRVGKRIAIGLSGDLWLVLHLMIAGRLHWFERGSKTRGRAPLARFEFDRGILTLTEAGTRRRASLHCCRAARRLPRPTRVAWKCWRRRSRPLRSG
jgi:formamidopyrimidine-DNA glycosylase